MSFVYNSDKMKVRKSFVWKTDNIRIRKSFVWITLKIKTIFLWSLLIDNV